MKLSIVIPAYNEEKRLAKTLDSYANFMKEYFGKDFEIIVVVNHCTDNTEFLANEAAQRHSQVRVVVESEKTGKGGAVKIGMRQSTGDFVGFVDADGATPPESFLKLYDNIGDAGCAIGSRWVEGAVVNPPQSFVRRKASRFLNKLIVHKAFGLDVEDSQCGAKVFRRKVVQQLLPVASERGWAFDIELLCLIKRTGYDFVEHPVEWHHVPGNPTSFFLMGMQMLASVWRVWNDVGRSRSSI